MEEIPTRIKIHLLVCVNERCEGSMPSCAPTITGPDVKEVKLWIQQQGWTGAVVTTKCQCLGFCNKDGGVACVYPSGRFFKGITTVNELKDIIVDEMDRL